MATKQRKQIGYYVPKEHVAEVKFLLAENYRLEREYSDISKEMDRLADEHFILYCENRDSSEALEVCGKWEIVSKVERDIYQEMGVVKTKLQTSHYIYL